MDDASALLLALAVAALALVAVGLGGQFTPLAGSWRDGSRLVRLRQLACVVRGDAKVEGGRQRFAGLCCFGRALLWRRDYGEDHLLSLGFPQPQLAKLQGRVTGVFVLRLDAAQARLHGNFYGRHFASSNGALVAGRFVPAAARELTRETADQPAL